MITSYEINQCCSGNYSEGWENPELPAWLRRVKDGWEFPGGKLEPGETGEQAIVREIQEELEVTIGNLDHLCTVEHDYETFHLSMQCYQANILSGEFKEHAHEDMKWLDTNNLWDVDWLPADVKVVKELEKKLGLK